MPLYDFTCTNVDCKHDFEEKLSLKEFEDKKEIFCPECKTIAERRISRLRSVSSSWKNWRL